MRNTKIVHQVTLKHMKMNAKRTLISTIGIALMVMLLTCVLVGKDTAFKYFTDMAAAQKGAYHYAVYNIDREKLEAIKSIKGVKEIGVTEDLKYTEFDKTGNPERPFLSIRRYSPEAMEWMNIKVVDGRLPGNPDEIAISRSAIDEGSTIKIGDKVDAETFRRFMSNNAEKGTTMFQSPFFQIPAGETLEVPDKMFYFVPGTDFGDEFYETHDEIHEKTGFAHSFTVVGIIETPMFEDQGCAWYTAMSMVDEASLKSETFNAMLMTSKISNRTEFDRRLIEIVGSENYYANDNVLIFSGVSSDDTLNFIIIAAQTFFIVLIMLISLVLIYNVFALSYDERVKYLGMLSSVGATGKQKRSSIYYESFMLLLPALPVGIGAGLGAVKIAARFIGPMAQKLFRFDGMGFIDLDPALSLKLPTIAIVILLSVATVFVSALIPAFKMSKVGPIESIRGNKNKKASKHRKTNADRMIGKSYERMLASRFLKNDKSKSSGIIRAVTIFLLVTTVVYFTASLLTQMVDYKLRDGGFMPKYYTDNTYMFYLSEQENTGAGTDAVSYIRGLEGVENVNICKSGISSLIISNDVLSEKYWDTVYEILSLYYPEGGYSREQFNEEYRSINDSTSTIGVYAFDDEVFAKMASDVNAVSYGEGELPCILLNSAAVSNTYGVHGAQPRHSRYIEIDDVFAVEAGDVLPASPMAPDREELIANGYDPDEIALPEIELDGPQDFRVIAKAGLSDLDKYFSGTEHSLLYIIVPMSVADYIDKINASPLSTTVYLDCDNTESVNDIQSMASQMEEAGYSCYFSATSNTMAEYKDILSYMIRIVLIVFTVIASMICLLNVYSSISALMVSRRKHFAVLKSVGSTFRQLAATELRESAGMLVRSLLISAPLTALICYSFSKVFVSRFGDFQVHFPWLFVLGLTVVIIALVILMMLMCLSREDKIDIIEEIKRESV